ncbi:hypothetical protein CANARDRAFT_28014 [[Candida] arabinofermentans NRRL YB-2248]|uniref:Probable NADPH dehydrogenase n=1 Tax=[Candida] arabinofermentans NRRL YB-2248 TaxID=983967 RepID=A0A1E4T2H7_9ASCO|nr:hypothetical protein CANARDRAFT_28014 [[Candida] arabinofermentans NRRL YB-2248]
MVSLAETNLFKPIKVGSTDLSTRVVFAPTTRYRNTEDFVATDAMLQYYSDRAENNGGLIITEATFGSPQMGLYEHGPMIYTDRQVKAWKQIVDAVHSKGTAMSVQIWNLGRAADPKLLKKHGLPFVAPSALYFSEESKQAAIEAGNELRPITIDEIESMKEDYVKAAKRAIFEAGFDFVEIHAAHGYLLDQFIQEVSNDRTDKYGGSIENRSRFVLEVIDLLIEAVGADKVAVRLSPYAHFQGSAGVESPEVHPISQFGYIFSQLEKRAKQGNRLAYLSIVEPRMSGGHENELPHDFNTSWIFEIYKGTIIRSGGYLIKKPYNFVVNDVNADDKTLIGFSRYFISNPDFVYRLKNDLEFTPYNRSLFYIFSNYGYNSWGKYGEPNLDADSVVATKVPQPLA